MGLSSLTYRIAYSWA